MKKSVLILFYFSLFLFNSSQGGWIARAPFAGSTRRAAAGFSIGTKGYVGTGSSNGNDFWEWDQPTNTWTQKANIGGASRQGGVGFSIGTKGYIGTGGNTDFWEWDQATNVWTQKAVFGGGNAVYAVGFSVGAKGYVSAGCAGNAFWEYDQATNTWTQRANYPGMSDCASTCFSIGNKGYMGLGIVNLGNDLWEYDPATNIWTKKANFPGTARGEAVGFAIGQYGYMGGGTTQVGSGDVPDFWRFNPATNSWSQVANYAGGLIEMATSFSIGCYGYVVTGYTNDSAPWNSNLWQFYDSTNTTCSTCVLAGNFQSSDTVFCSEPTKCIDFTDNSACNPTGWHWRFPGGYPDTSSQQNPTNICYGAPGTYAVTLIVTNSSGTDSLTVSPMITVGGTPPPPVITTGGNTLYSSHGSSYQWYLNGNIIAGATDSFYVFTQPGTYSVRINDAGGCSSLSQGLILSVQNISDGGGRVEVYPNPAGDQMIVRSPEFAVQNAQLEIFNVLGENVYQQEINSSDHAVVNIKNLAPGVYFILIRGLRSSFTAKFVKE